MQFPLNIYAEVDRLARLRYVNRAETRLWNEHRREGELRLLTGWSWTARNGRTYRQGFKTKTVAYRDAWYSLVKEAAAPPVDRPRLRVVSSRRAA
jgi:hypothetical protein